MADTRRGGGRDLTTGPINRTLLMFALPTLASSILQSLNGSINTIWVGRFLGEGALAATSNANLVMFLMFAAVFGLGMAATILIGQSMGRRDIEGVRRILGGALGLFIVLGAVVAVVGWVLTPALLRLLATPAEVFPLAVSYLRVIILGLPFSFITILLFMALRGTGDAMTPMWFMILAAIIDVGLNPVFILGLGPAPRLGIAGSATATLVANVIGLVGLVATIQLRDLTIRLKGRDWRYLLPDRALVRMLIGKGLPMGLQMIVLSASALAMIGLVNRYGVVTTAAYGVSSQLWTYIQMPAMALGAAVSAMAAQNIGAGKWDRVGQVTRAGVIMGMILTAALVALVTLVDRQVLALFLGRGSPAIEIARHIHLVVSWSFVLFAVSFVLSGVMRGNGAVIVPLVILTIATLPVRLGLAVAGTPSFGADAIWWSFPAGSVVSLILTVSYYRWGKWRGMSLALPPTPHETEEAALAAAEPGGRMQPST